MFVQLKGFDQLMSVPLAPVQNNVPGFATGIEMFNPTVVDATLTPFVAVMTSV